MDQIFTPRGTQAESYEYQKLTNVIFKNLPMLYLQILNRHMILLTEDSYLGH